MHVTNLPPAFHADSADPSDYSFTSLPSSIGTISQLEELVLSRPVGGTLPAEVGLLKNLRILSLAGRFESDGGTNGTLPSEWSSLRNLTSLSLSNFNNLWGEL